MITKQDILNYIDELKMLCEYEKERQVAYSTRLYANKFTLVDWYEKQIKKFESKL